MISSQNTPLVIALGMSLPFLHFHHGMKKTLAMLILMTLGFYSCGQINPSTRDKVLNDVKTVDTINIDESSIQTQEYSANNHIHTETNYTDPTGRGVIIQNGFPRGGGRVSDDIDYGYAVFWSRVQNKTDSLIEIIINFPADSIIIFPSSNGHIKLLVPQDTMTMDKVSKFSYGLKNIKTIVENNFHQSSQIHRTIKPNEETIFYVVLLSHFDLSDQVIRRTGLFLEGQDLFYRLSIDASSSKIIPCGKIAFLSNRD